MPDPKADVAAPAVPLDTVSADVNSTPSSGTHLVWPNPATVLRPAEREGELGRLGGFRVVRLLGQGGMGAVFAAEDPLLKRKLALKVMRPELVTRADARERFVREAQAAAAVEHDHIVPVFQVGEDNGVLFIAMPLLQGQTLDDRLADGRLSVATVLKIGREVAEALAAAHGAGLIHRDIKPGNLWLEGKPGEGAHGFRRVKVLDFGLARVATDDTRLTGNRMIGTPPYMSPEQAGGKPVDHRTDLFSLGGVLYRCLTGNRPFPGTTTFEVLTALATKNPPTVSAVAPHVSDTLSDLVMALLAKEPANRPPSATAVADELGRIREPSASTETLSLPDPVAPKPRRRWPLAVGAAAVALVAAVAGVVVVKVRGPDGKETEVRAPEGSTVDIDAKGNVVVTLPGAASDIAVAPMPRSVDPDELECVLKAGTSRVNWAVTLPDSNTIVAGYEDGFLRVWNISKRTVVREHDTGAGVRCLALHPDGKTIAVNTEGGNLFTWDATTGNVIRHYTHWFTGSYVKGSAMDFALGGRLLITPADGQGMILAWDTVTGERRVLTQLPDKSENGFVRSSPDGREAVILGVSESLPRVLKLPGGETVWESDLPGSSCIPTFGAGGRLLAYRSRYASIVVSDRGPRISENHFSSGGEPTFHLAFCPEGKMLAGACGRSGVKVWRIAGSPLPSRTLGNPSKTTDVHRVAFTPDGKRLVSCCDNGTICVFRVSPEWSVPRKPYPPADPAWLARVHALPADEQIKEVSAELVRRNPGFDGKVEAEQGDGRVRAVGLITDEVEDIAPLRGFHHLTHLGANGTRKFGKLWDLTPLVGSNLTSLRVQHNPLWDLRPLKGMHLTELLIDSTWTSDLTPLADSRIWNLGLANCPVRDLSPLKGVSLNTLWLHNCWRVTDLGLLRGSTVRDLTLPPTFAGDLSPLIETPLESLQVINDDFRFTPDQRKALTAVKSLKTINGKPVAEYWKAVDAMPSAKK